MICKVFNIYIYKSLNISSVPYSTINVIISKFPLYAITMQISASFQLAYPQIFTLHNTVYDDDILSTGIRMYALSASYDRLRRMCEY